jgi:C_GCAxxG_C_C family probable redox protein
MDKESAQAEMMALAQDGFRCSQIMLALGLQRQGKESSDVIRTMEGLIVGVGHSGKICGALTGGTCLIALYAGRGRSDEEEHPLLWPMIHEFVEWFDSEIGENRGIVDCDLILQRAGAAAPSPEVCGPVVLKAYMKAISVLEDNAL